MAFTVRRLQPGDAAMLRAMNVIFGKAFDDARSFAAPPHDEYIETLLAKEHVIVLAALDHGEVIGGLVAYELAKFEQARSEIYIYDLAVEEARRRQGVATALIDEVRAIAARRCAWVIYVQADYGDEPAIALYSKIGRREDVMHFDIDPAEPT